MLRVLNKIKFEMTRVLEYVLIFAVFALVASVVWGVFTRAAGGWVVSLSGGSETGIWAFLPTGQAKWTEELSRFLLIWVSLLGGAVAFGRHGHLGVDYFVGKLHRDVRLVSAMVVHAVVLFFAIAVLIIGGIKVVSIAFTMEQMTPALNWKMGYVYLALPISGVFVVLYTLESAVVTIAQMRGVEVAEPVGDAQIIEPQSDQEAL